jgi:hypothetical protein
MATAAPVGTAVATTEFVVTELLVGAEGGG